MWKQVRQLNKVKREYITKNKLQKRMRLQRCVNTEDKVANLYGKGINGTFEIKFKTERIQIIIKAAVQQCILA